MRPGSRLPLATRAPITAAAREGKPVWAQHRREFVSRFADGAALAPDAAGALAVPVMSGGKIVGAIGFPFAEPDAITERGAIRPLTSYRPVRRSRLRTSVVCGKR